MGNSSRPYLIRAIYQWIVDNDEIPHVLVDATADGTQVPAGFVEDGQITLNISPSAVRNFMISDDYLSFNARFGGVAQDVFVPLNAIKAIFDRTYGHGMAFSEQDMAFPERQPPEPPQTPSDISPEGDKAAKRGSHLKIIK